MSLLQSLLIALGLSVAGNVVLGWAWVDTHEKAAMRGIERDVARSAASACSDATEDLRELADKRGLEARKAQVAARNAATARQQAANAILSTPPAVAGDACASAKARVEAWLAERGQP